MLKDDRMMSMLTFLVIMVAVGAMIQRVDVLDRFFGEGTVELELVRDQAIVRANTLSSIDVLANDLGVGDDDGVKLIIARQPECGRAFVRDGKVQYLPVKRCVGSQVFNYALSGRGDGTTGEVTVVVRLAAPARTEATADARRDIPAPAPMVPRTAQQRVGESPALLAAQPPAGAASVGAIVPVPMVPRPQAPAIAGLPDRAAGGGVAAAAGVTFGGPGPAPRISEPAGGLAASPEIAAVPVVPQPDPEAPPLPAGSAAAGTADQAGATLALARVDPAPPAADDAAGDATGSGIQRENGGLGANVPRTGPREIGSGGSGTTGSGEPADALAGIRALGAAAGLAPVDTTPPAALTGSVAATGTGASQPASPASPALPASPASPAARVAALPPAAAQCTVPPTVIFEVKPAGLTEVIVDSPCHAGTVAELSYDGLRFGVALDRAGTGAVAAIGFRQASDAVLSFAGGETVDFNIQFADTERMVRVALIWDMPVDLDLNAFEFGALPGSEGHVRPDRPRSFDDVRRGGGGYLLEYRPVGGVGQNVGVYTYWRSYGGRSGVVKLKLDFASREGRQRPDTCGGGALADPGFAVLRSDAGKLERSRRRRLAPLDCDAVAGAGAGATDRYIGDAVGDMIVLQR